jgi:hypothetical protein
VISYFLAETTILGLKMYHDIKKIRGVSDGYAKSSAPSASTSKPKPEEGTKEDKSEDKK